MKTKQEIVGFIFGANLPLLNDIGDCLTEEHVVRHWMFCSDRRIKKAGNGDPAKASMLGKKVNNEISHSHAGEKIHSSDTTISPHSVLKLEKM